LTSGPQELTVAIKLLSTEVEKKSPRKETPVWENRQKKSTRGRKDRVRCGGGRIHPKVYLVERTAKGLSTGNPQRLFEEISKQRGCGKEQGL